MLGTIKSEFLKLLTIRSTYFVTGFVLLLVSYLSVHVFGYLQSAQKATSPLFMADTLYTMLGTFVTFAAIIAILHVAHEYRYNTILYTLTSSRSRLKVLGVKTLVMLTYATVVGAVVLLITYFGAKLGVALKGDALVSQSLPVWDLLGQYLFYTWGYTLVGVVLAVLIRGLVGSVVAFFLIPTVEGILSLILKGNTKYLPFNALDAVAATPNQAAISLGLETLSRGTAAVVFSVYLAAAATVAIVLFVRRDAN